MTMEMLEMINGLAKVYGINTCEHCPYAETCEKRELFWGCPVWEEQMGEDL